MGKMLRHGLWDGGGRSGQADPIESGIGWSREVVQEWSLMAANGT